jgi:hypothetical protein
MEIPSLGNLAATANAVSYLRLCVPPLLFTENISLVQQLHKGTLDSLFEISTQCNGIGFKLLTALILCC